MKEQWVDFAGIRFKLKEFNFRELIIDWENVKDKNGKEVIDREDLYAVLDDLPDFEEMLKETYYWLRWNKK